jgi:Na+/melibiose symporter-like transporter
MALYGYHANQPQTPQTLEGIRMCSSIYVGVMFAICTGLLIAYQINKDLTIQIANELAERRKRFANATPIGSQPAIGAKAEV